MDGVLNINKPAGMTSHDVVGRVRRALKTRRVGHAGTLDPDAVGVLLIAVGQATRLLPYLPTEPKEYVARLLLGVSTSTEDASGSVIAEADASAVTAAALQAILPRFIGTIQQVPPMVSALHHEGRRLYELAREGVTVERQPRPVVIHSLHVSDFLPGARAEATLRVVCGGGTYIRTLCADIGAALGLPAHMKSLAREAVGPFRREDAVSLDDLNGDSPAAFLMPMEQALDVPGVAVSDEDAARLERGQSVEGLPRTDAGAAQPVFALLHRERLRALARWEEDGAFYPFKVFAFEGEEKPA